MSSWKAESSFKLETYLLLIKTLITFFSILQKIYRNESRVQLYILSACCWSLLGLSYDGLKTARDSCCTLDTLDIRAIPIYKSYSYGRQSFRGTIFLWFEVIYLRILQPSIDIDHNVKEVNHAINTTDSPSKSKRRKLSASYMVYTWRRSSTFLSVFHCLLPTQSESV